MGIDPFGNFIIFWGQKNSRSDAWHRKGIREFNDAKDHVKNEIEAGMNEKDVVKNTPASTSTTAQ